MGIKTKQMHQKMVINDNKLLSHCLKLRFFLFIDGDGADECLLDEAPEFSEADMQRAIETKEADDQQNNGVDDEVDAEGNDDGKNHLKNL